MDKGLFELADFFLASCRLSVGHIARHAPSLGSATVADTLRRTARQPAQNKFRNLVKAMNRTALY